MVSAIQMNMAAGVQLPDKLVNMVGGHQVKRVVLSGPLALADKALGVVETGFAMRAEECNSGVAALVTRCRRCSASQLANHQLLCKLENLQLFLRD